MTRKDGLLALLVVVVWGLNFVVIKLGLHNMPPLMLAGLRFMLVAFPALTLTGQAAGGDRAGDLRRAGAGGGEPRRGACPTGGFYADPGGGAQLGLRQYFQQENHVPGEPAANHVAGGLERADPGAAVYAGLIVDRWPADHAGESATHRSANDTVAALSGVYRHYRRLWHLGSAAGEV